LYATLYICVPKPNPRSNMPTIVDSLESRTLFSAPSVSAATLLTDHIRITSDALNASAALKKLTSALQVDTSTITADLKTVPQGANSPELKALIADQATALANLEQALTALTRPGSQLSRKSATDGQTLLTTPTPKTVAVVGADITKLSTVTATPLTDLTAALSNTTITDDLNALVTANPDSKRLASSVKTALGNYTKQTAAIDKVTRKFSTDLSTLASHLSVVKDVQGTIPNLVGTFKGAFAKLTGNGAGTSAGITVTFTSQDAVGNVIATIVRADGAVLDLSGSVALGGTFTGKFSSVDNGSGTLKGQFRNGLISGTYTSQDGTQRGSGTFKLTMKP
jgi:hypothetical protein